MNGRLSSTFSEALLSEPVPLNVNALPRANSMMMNRSAHWDDVLRLMTFLLKASAHRGAAGGTTMGTRGHFQYRCAGVVFDLNVDGYRYVLTCAPMTGVHADADDDEAVLEGQDDDDAFAWAFDDEFEANRLYVDAAADKEVSLSPREREIANLIARGYKTRFIAMALNISVHTVSTYIRRIFTKLDVHTRAEVIAKLAGLKP